MIRFLLDYTRANPDKYGRLDAHVRITSTKTGKSLVVEAFGVNAGYRARQLLGCGYAAVKSTETWYPIRQYRKLAKNVTFEPAPHNTDETLTLAQLEALEFLTVE